MLFKAFKRERAKEGLSLTRSGAYPVRAASDDRAKWEADSETAVRAVGNEPDRRVLPARPVPEPDLRLMRRIDELSRDERGRPIASPPVLLDIESDPVLANVKLIAEAWDAAGLYQVGGFVGDAWKEWNGTFRDDVRRFLKGDEGTVRSLACRILGSPDIYGELIAQHRVEWHGVALGHPDWSYLSHSLAATCHFDSDHVALHLMINAYWEALTFAIPPLDEKYGPWRRCVDTFRPAPGDIRGWLDAETVRGGTFVVQPRSIVALVTKSNNPPYGTSRQQLRPTMCYHPILSDLLQRFLTNPATT